MPHPDTTSAFAALRAVLEGAGATLPRRDLVDVRIVEQVKSGKGRLINSQNDVGGWPVYESADRAGGHRWRRHPGRVGDGARPRSERSGSDGAKLRPDGYTNLESLPEFDRRKVRSGVSHALERRLMVDRHLAGRGIRDRRVLEAMGAIRRECFVPEEHSVPRLCRRAGRRSAMGRRSRSPT